MSSFYCIMTFLHVKFDFCVLVTADQFLQSLPKLYIYHAL